MTDFAELTGKTITIIDGLEPGSGRVEFTTSDGARYVMQHIEDCCESVEVEDVNGNIDDLIGSPVTLAEESTSEEDPEGVTPERWDDSQTWTFYRIATAKGFVVIRWYGTSNGYYSESVDFSKESA